MSVDPIVQQIVNRCHVGQSNRQVTRYLISRMRHGWQTFQAMSKPERRELMKQIIAQHRANRKLYRAVMSGRF